MRARDATFIPYHMLKTMQAYAEDHQPVGEFLQAIITNDLKEAVMRADDDNLEIIPAYVNWFYWNAPGSCWGSKEAYNNWIKQPQKTPVEVGMERAAEARVMAANERREWNED